VALANPLAGTVQTNAIVQAQQVAPKPAIDKSKAVINRIVGLVFFSLLSVFLVRLFVEEPESSEVEFKVGDHIWVNGIKSGTIAYIGEAKFKEGEWAGIILDVADGKNNGTVDGVSYFHTEENRGIFCRLSKLTKDPHADTSADSPRQHETQTAQATVAPQVSYDLKIGDRVSVNSNNGTKKGYLRYVGTTEFAKGDWAGVELDDKMGKNDGSVNGKR
jgi:CAP-Gly domain-containing linker protein 1